MHINTILGNPGGMLHPWVNEDDKYRKKNNSSQTAKMFYLCHNESGSLVGILTYEVCWNDQFIPRQS